MDSDGISVFFDFIKDQPLTGYKKGFLLRGKYPGHPIFAYRTAKFAVDSTSVPD
jgi:hypothetical protein